MRTIKFSVLCLLLGIATAELCAQWPDAPKNKNGTGVVIENRVWVCDHSNLFYFWNDAPIALTSLSGSTSAHIEYFFKNGMRQYVKYQVRGEVQSNIPPFENFKLCENGTDYDREDPGFSTLKLNFIGDHGSHYIIDATTFWGGPFTIDKFIFLENEK
jgi:hypothetical protein